MGIFNVCQCYQNGRYPILQLRMQNILAPYWLVDSISVFSF